MKAFRLSLALAILVAPLASHADGSNPDPRAVIANKVPGTKLEDVHATPIPGVFELMRGTDAAYVSADGKYAIAGDLYDLASNNDLTDVQRRDVRLKLLGDIPESQMVIFGPNTESWTKAEQVWCSPDRNDALTRAKRGEALKAKVCPNTPVAREYALGQKFNLQGTPAIVLANGDMLPGYVSPTELAQELHKIDR